jgi:Fe-S-cluster containining protein
MPKPAKKRKNRQDSASEMKKPVQDPAHFAMEKAFTVSRKIKKILKQARSAEDLATGMLEIFSLADKACEVIIDDFPPPHPIACKKGCGYCCRVKVEATIPEILHLAEYMKKTLTPPALAVVRGRISSVSLKTSAREENYWVEQGIICPFLVDDSCLIHPARPFACRCINSMDIFGCRKFFETKDPETKILQYSYQKQVYTACEMGLQMGVAQAGLEASWVELTRALIIALDLTKGIEDWLAAKVLFASAHVKDPLPWYMEKAGYQTYI